jgi:hypothetical protein
MKMTNGTVDAISGDSIAESNPIDEINTAHYQAKAICCVLSCKGNDELDDDTVSWAMRAAQDLIDRAERATEKLEREGCAGRPEWLEMGAAHAEAKAICKLVGVARQDELRDHSVSNALWAAQDLIDRADAAAVKLYREIVTADK